MADPASKCDAVTIGEAACRVGLTPRAIRYYEQIGLIEAASRSTRNYRLYDVEALHELRSIAHCRAIGMSVAGLRALRFGLPLRTKKDRRTNLLREQLKLTDARIRELLSLRRELQQLLDLVPANPSVETALHPPAGAGCSPRSAPTRRVI